MCRARAHADRGQVLPALLRCCRLASPDTVPGRSLDAWCTRQYDYYQRVVNGQ